LNWQFGGLVQMRAVRLWTNTVFRLAAGTYFVLTSLYCLLAFLPYTYYFLIKAPAYAWMPWFVHHHAALYWIAAGSLLIAGRRSSGSVQSRSWSLFVNAGWLTAVGIYITLHPFLTGLENGRGAYVWSLAALLPLAITSVWKLAVPGSAHLSANDQTSARLFPYSGVLLTAGIVSVVYMAGARMRIYSQTHFLSFHATDAEFVAWSLISHVVLAIAVFSVINFVAIIAARTPRPRFLQCVLNGTLIFACLWPILYRFLDSALSFGGWPAQIYAASLALTLSLWGFALVLPFLDWQVAASESRPLAGTVKKFPVFTWCALAAFCALAIAFPYIVGDADWSGFIASIVTFSLWIAVSVCVFRLRPARAHYPVTVLIVVMVISAMTYKGLQASEIFWSRPLGSTDDEISLTLESYAGHDTSFLLAHHILGNARHEVCGDLCRILRENTNIRDTQAHTDIQLVEPLTPSTSERPNIFVFVIDSMRPDYLGAYNSSVDYTPNLDAFARDSIVLHHVYSQYAGTSLSEPAIWSGAMLLHAHYPQPFSRLNSLDRMLHTDGYREIVSNDEILSVILPQNDDVVRLDTDLKLWNQLEIGSTLRQAEAWLDSRRDTKLPVFFYTQPKNVHQFARNDVPSPASQRWPERPGLNTRLTYEVHWVDSCLGQFFGYLKQRGLYDSSIIIVTSDHGDATGEFGRQNHSTSIWPEIMRVPLIIHLPAAMRSRFVYDDTRLSTLTDLTPTLYYLLGHRPIRQNPLYGRPLLAETKQEIDSYASHDFLLASDVRAVYGILSADGRYLYTTYDSPAQSYLFDLAADPNTEHSILTAPLKQRYDEEIIQQLHMVGDYYRYKPGVGSLLASAQ
jgi:hypothetical protein